MQIFCIIIQFDLVLRLDHLLWGKTGELQEYSCGVSLLSLYNDFRKLLGIPS